MSHGPGQSRGEPMRRGPMGRMMKGDKAKDFKGSMVKLISYLGKYKLIIIIAIIIAIASTAATIIGPKILGEATTSLFEGLIAVVSGTGKVDFDFIAKIILITLSFYLPQYSIIFKVGLWREFPQIFLIDSEKIYPKR